MAEAGVAGYETQTWLGLVAAAGTPREIVLRLNGETKKVLAQPDARDKLVAQGLTVVGSSPDEFAAHIRSEYAKWAKVIKDANIKPE
jgi:tripartite-type tricarboxylate transporter receptor subunit TctC